MAGVLMGGYVPQDEVLGNRDVDAQQVRNAIIETFPETSREWLPPHRTVYWDNDEVFELAALDVSSVMDDGMSPVHPGVAITPVGQVYPAMGYELEMTDTERSAKNRYAAKFFLPVPIVFISAFFQEIPWSALIALVYTIGMLMYLSGSDKRLRVGRYAALQGAPEYASSLWSAERKEAALRTLKSGGTVPVLARWHDAHTLVVKVMSGVDGDISHVVYNV
jgi:hypothetical protein